MIKPPSPRTERLLLLVAIALGGALRLYRLDTLPPGDGFDVAQYGVDALQILGGARPIFLESNFGREPLFSYLVALAFTVVGPGAFGIRLVSALAGILTIPAAFFAARELPAEQRGAALAWLPSLVAFLVAVSYWHLIWSRIGLRVILVPLFTCLIAAFLWRAFRTQSRVDYALTGLLLGLNLYTYQAARLLPLLVAGAFLLHALGRRRWSREDTIGAVAVAALALAVFMPLGVYAWQHPGALSARIEQAVVVQGNAPLSDQLAPLARQAAAALLMFGIRGDVDPAFNVPGRPVLDPFLFAFLLAGIGLALWRWRRPSYLFLLAWLALMTAPAMVADLAAVSKRALAAQPPAAILIALAIVWPLDRLLGQRARRVYLGLVALGLAFSAWATFRDYFIVWAADPDLPTHFQVDYAQIGAAIGRVPASDRVYLSPYPPDHPVIQLHAALREDVRGYNGRYCLPFPTSGDSAPATHWFIVPGLQDASLAQIGAAYPTAVITDGPLRPGSDRPAYRQVTVEGVEPNGLFVGHPSNAVWNGEIALVGSDAPPMAVPGETLTVTLTYEAVAEIPADYVGFVHLLGPLKADGNPVYAQADSQPCGGARSTSSWQTDERLRDTITLSLPADLAPGDYSLVTGFYTWPEIERLPVDGDRPDGLVTLATVSVR